MGRARLTKHELLNCDGGSPAVFFVQYTKADGARRIDVGVEERRLELALGGLNADSIEASDREGKWVGQIPRTEGENAPRTPFFWQLTFTGYSSGNSMRTL